MIYEGDMCQALVKVFVREEEMTFVQHNQAGKQWLADFAFTTNQYAQQFYMVKISVSR
jgi:hypothetical protein